MTKYEKKYCNKYYQKKVEEKKRLIEEGLIEDKKAGRPKLYSNKEKKKRHCVLVKISNYITKRCKNWIKEYEPELYKRFEILAKNKYKEKE